MMEQLGPAPPPLQQIIISFDPPSCLLPSCESDHFSRHSQMLLCLDVNYEINQIFCVVLFIITDSLCHTCKLYSNQYLKYLHILSGRNKISNSLHQSPLGHQFLVLSLSNEEDASNRPRCLHQSCPTRCRGLFRGIIAGASSLMP